MGYLLEKAILTYSAIILFLRCPRAYYWRYVKQLVKIRFTPLPLFFGTVIHHALDIWHHTRDLTKALLGIDKEFLLHESDQNGVDHVEKARAKALMKGYAYTYPEEDFDVKLIETEFNIPIINPDTGRQSRSFTLRGVFDMIVEKLGYAWLFEHKTTGRTTGAYLDRLWSDFQVTLYSYAMSLTGYRLKGVVYNILEKTKHQQKKTEDLKAFEDRMVEEYQNPSHFDRQELLFLHQHHETACRLVWTVIQRILECRLTGYWHQNPAACWQYDRACQYYSICRNNDNPLEIQNNFEHKDPHPELGRKHGATN